MCGICGIVRKPGRTLGFDGGERVRAMCARLQHRGPDGEGLLVDEQAGVFIGHRRLSIIDLSPAGNQPFYSEDRNVAAVVNGEIYNFKDLRSGLLARGHALIGQSDCETIPHLYEDGGSACWEHLRGMFAAAVYDRRAGVVELVRDPLGIKPLYLYEGDSFLAFASEVGAIADLTGDGQPDYQGLVEFLMLGSVPPPRTHRRGIRALLPGEVVTLHGVNARSRRMAGVPDWASEAIESRAGRPVWEAVRESVILHMVSDAPIGVFLSGGIDSGVMAGLAREGGHARVKTVAVTLPGHALDEARYARMTAERFGTEHVEIPVIQADFETALDHFLQHIDMPSIDGFNTYVVSRAAREAGLTVALSGLGGDELFAGYPTFRWAPGVHRFLQFAEALGAGARRACARWLESGARSSGATRVAEVIRRYPAELRSGYLAYRGLFLGEHLEALLEPAYRGLARQAWERFMDETAWIESYRPYPELAVALLELTRYMRTQLLRDTDVMSMAHSLEVRVPLVDRDVVRAALAALVQGDSRRHGPKWRLRRSLRQPLPRAVVRRRKQGFVFPWQEWVGGRILDGYGEVTGGGLLAADTAAKLVAGYRSGRLHWSQLWGAWFAKRASAADCRAGSSPR